MDYKSVKISEDAKIARQSVVIGDVTIGRDSCVLHYAVGLWKTDGKSTRRSIYPGHGNV